MYLITTKAKATLIEAEGGLPESSLETNVNNSPTIHPLSQSTLHIEQNDRGLLTENPLETEIQGEVLLRKIYCTLRPHHRHNTLPDIWHDLIKDKANSERSEAILALTLTFSWWWYGCDKLGRWAVSL